MGYIRVTGIYPCFEAEKGPLSRNNFVLGMVSVWEGGGALIKLQPRGNIGLRRSTRTTAGTRVIAIEMKRKRLLRGYIEKCLGP
jgi:hypothetical protein